MSKDVCQQVVMGAQTRDLAAVKLAEVVISIVMLDAVPIDRGCDRNWSWHHHPPCRSASQSFSAGQKAAATCGQIITMRSHSIATLTTTC